MSNKQPALVLATSRLNRSIDIGLPGVRAAVDFPYRLRRGVNHLDKPAVLVLLTNIARLLQVHQ